MAITLSEVLIPEFWASSFDEVNAGEYQLQNLVSRQFESQVGQMGDVVNVPIQPDFAAIDWTPGDSISGQAATQTTAAITLNKSKRSTINLTGRELSLSAYDLITSYGAGLAKSIIKSVNEAIYVEMLSSPYFVDATGGISADLIADAGTLLSKNEVSTMDRKFVASPDVIGALLKSDAFQLVSDAGTNDVMKDGMITRRMGFDFFVNNAIAKYTPADLTGAVAITSTGVVLGDTSMVVDGFNDDARPVRVGDIFKFTGDSTNVYTVTSTVVTSGDTTTIGFYPAAKAAYADDCVVTITPAQSGLAFVPSGIALCARPYAILPNGSGVNSSVINYRGFPIRISVWNDANLGLNVQMDALFGTKVINSKRIVRVIEDL